MAEPDRKASLGRPTAHWAFIDFCLLVILALLLLPHQPKQEEAEQKPPRGQIVVEIRWPDGMNSDVDLWVQGPGDRPVGYARKSGVVFDLQRDDLGSSNDFLKLNYEIARSRFRRPGAYAVNIHLYRNLEASSPVPVDWQVTARPEGGAAAPICRGHADLVTAGQELTLCRFSLGPKGKLVGGSINSVQIPLRSR